MMLKWSKLALDAYKLAVEDMKAKGFRAMREIKDADCGTVLTLWTGPYKDGYGIVLVVVIQQTWTDTGDVVFYREAGRSVADVVPDAI